MVRPEWDATPPDEGQARAIHPYLRGDGRAAHEGASPNPQCQTFTTVPTSSAHAAREPARDVQRRREGVQRATAPLHAHAQHHSAQPHWETDLAPRILLGLWHPRFLPYAREILPYCRRSCISRDVSIARNYFWKSCDAFSVNFYVLASWEGQRCGAARLLPGSAREV